MANESLEQLRELFKNSPKDGERICNLFEFLEHPQATWRDVTFAMETPEPIASMAAAYFHRRFRVPFKAGVGITDTEYWCRILKGQGIDIDSKVR